MRPIVLVITLFITAVGFSQQAVFYCAKKTLKFPKTAEGELLSWNYSIVNKGQLPLEIYSADVECSCTEVVLPIGPILPGKSAEIKVTFNTRERPFYQDRLIRLSTNSKKKLETLRFKVYVIPE